MDSDGTSPTQLHILHQDDVCVAIDKPAGLLVHRTPVDSRATQFAMQLVRDQTGRLVYPVHRLDKPTSGVLMFAFDSATARFLTEQFASRTAEKTYTAFVRGFCDDSGTLDTRLRDPVDARSETRKASAKRESITRFRTIARYELPISDGRHETSRYSLLELRPGTGRRHQIRRHLKHAAHPILGDTTHGDHRHNRRMAQRYGLTRMFLVANRLLISHPDGHQLDLTARLGEEFDRLLSEVG